MRSEKAVDSLFKCDALRNMLRVVQFKKREKHPWRSLTQSNLKYHSSMSVFHVFEIVQMVPNRAKRLIKM